MQKGGDDWVSRTTAQAAGFAIGGEELAIDLADTIITTTDPHTDALAGADRLETFWALQMPRLPEGARAPGRRATVALRTAVREILDAALAGRSPRATSISQVNDAAAGATQWVALDHRGDTYTADVRWVAPNGASIALAAVAQSLIDVVNSPRLERLRQCANPNCSMLFLADDARRKWCTPNICGNRARVARHYHRHQGEALE